MSKKRKQYKRSGAVAKAWAIFSKHPKERAAALAAAEKAGLNANTAKTQWQRFIHASPKQRAAKVAGEKNGNGATKQEPAAQS